MLSPIRDHQDESVRTPSTLPSIAVLDPEPQIPWLETFELLSGVDALTGEPKLSALKGSTVWDKSRPKNGSTKANTIVRAICGAHQQSRKHKIKWQGTVNPVSPNPLALNASFAMQTSHLSSNRSFLVETVVSGEHDFEKLDLGVLELTPEALALSRTPEEFRKRHGDYFVLGFKRRYWFHALVKCRSNEVTDDRAIEDSAKIAWKDLIDLQLEAELNERDFTFDLNSIAWVSHSGCEILTTAASGASESESTTAAPSVTCKDVIQMVKSILTTEQSGWREIALLVPYSRVISTFPNTVPVSREVFDTLHELEAMAVQLDHDCLHPAFGRYRDKAKGARAAVEQFRTNRASFITNNTALGLEDARRLLENAEGEVRSLIRRYDFMEKLVKEWRGRPQIGQKFEVQDAYQKWIHGVVSTDERITPKVTLTDGTVAFQSKFEGKIRNILPFTHNFLRVECRERHSFGVLSDSGSHDPSTLILSHPSGYIIVGWSLSIKTKRRGPKSFSVRGGGILGSNLKIDVKAPIFRQATWRCRIYYIDKGDYDFPHLTSK